MSTIVLLNSYYNPRMGGFYHFHFTDETVEASNCKVESHISTTWRSPVRCFSQPDHRFSIFYEYQAGPNSCSLGKFSVELSGPQLSASLPKKPNDLIFGWLFLLWGRNAWAIPVSCGPRNLCDVRLARAGIRLQTWGRCL